MNIRNSMKDERIWYLYNKLEEYKTSKLTLPNFCAINEIKFSTMNNFKFTLSLNRIYDPEISKKYDLIMDEIKNKNIFISSISKKTGIKEGELSLIRMHFHYLEVINQFKQSSQKNKEENMDFVKVKQNTKEINPKIVKNEPELIEKQNDLEIIISKGIKVSISPNIEPMNVIKIIELLRTI